MSDDKSKVGHEDRSHINPNEDYEVRCWAKHLGVGRDELEAEIDKVGNSAAAVRKQLGK